jgi:transcriptional regulator with XRE-family HTH domain
MFGERLQELRLDAGISQKELAEKVHISFHSISSYERNRSIPNDEIKVKFAKIFNISLDYLLGLTNTRFSYKRNENMIYIPEKLPKEAKEDIEKYIDLVKYRYEINK